MIKSVVPCKRWQLVGLSGCYACFRNAVRFLGRETGCMKKGRKPGDETRVWARMKRGQYVYNAERVVLVHCLSIDLLRRQAQE